MTKHICYLLVATLILLTASHSFCQPEEQWRLVAKKALSGEELTPETIDTCHEQFLAYFNALCATNKAENVYGFSDEDNAMHYVNSIVLAVIDPQRHGGWPAQHVGRRKAYDVIKKKLQSGDDVHLTVALIIPAIDNGQAEVAVESYKSLHTQDPAWAKYILGFVQEHYPYKAEAEDFLAAVSKLTTDMYDNKPDAGDVPKAAPEE